MSRTLITTMLLAIGLCQLASALPSFADSDTSSQGGAVSAPVSPIADSAKPSASASGKGSAEGALLQTRVGAPWSWRKAGAAEYLGIAAAAAGALYVEEKSGEHDQAHWTSRNGFDEGIRGALRLESRSARDAAQTASTVLMGIMIGAPVVDSLATLGIRDARWDAAWQTELINAESFTFAGLTSTLLESLFARQRPLARDCGGGNCSEDQQNQSMPSGHAALAFTGAGLLCTHHAYQTLYADPDSDRALCATGLVVATAEAFLRIMSDRHYPPTSWPAPASGFFPDSCSPACCTTTGRRSLPGGPGSIATPSFSRWQ